MRCYLKPIKPCSALLVTSHCAEKIVSACLRGFCVSRKGGTEGGRWLLGLVGTRWATSPPDCMDRIRKHYSRLVEFSGEEGCLGSEQVYDNQ